MAFIIIKKIPWQKKVFSKTSSPLISLSTLTCKNIMYTESKKLEDELSKRLWGNKVWQSMIYSLFTQD
jgi:hypothetical protein